MALHEPRQANRQARASSPARRPNSPEEHCPIVTHWMDTAPVHADSTRGVCRAVHRAERKAPLAGRVEPGQLHFVPDDAVVRFSSSVEIAASEDRRGGEVPARVPSSLREKMSRSVAALFSLLLRAISRPPSLGSGVPSRFPFSTSPAVLRSSTRQKVPGKEGFGNVGISRTRVGNSPSTARRARALTRLRSRPK